MHSKVQNVVLVPKWQLFWLPPTTLIVVLSNELELMAMEGLAMAGPSLERTKGKYSRFGNSNSALFNLTNPGMPLVDLVNNLWNMLDCTCGEFQAIPRYKRLPEDQEFYKLVRRCYGARGTSGSLGLCLPICSQALYHSHYLNFPSSCRLIGYPLYLASLQVSLHYII